MFRQFGPERLSIRLLLVGLLIAGVPSAGYAEIGEPPDPATENLRGPATVGTATITPADGTTINIQFAGVCGRSGAVFYGTANLAFGSVTAANLVDHRIGVISAFGFPCYVGLVGDLIINTVTSFTANDTSGDGLVDQIITDLVILAVVPR